MNQMQQNLQKLLSEKHLTAASLARKAEIQNVSTVQNIIYGRTSNPTISIVIKLAKALDCSISDIVGLSPEYPNCQTTEETLLFHENLNAITNLLIEQPLALPIHETLKLASHAYEYCLVNNKKNADKSFCKWLITQLNKQ